MCSFSLPWKVSALTCAIENGFAYAVVGAPLIMCDGLRGHTAQDVEIDGKIFASVSIAADTLPDPACTTRATPAACPALGARIFRIDLGKQRVVLADPDALARTYLHVLQQDRSAWTWEIELRPWVERF